MAVSTPPTVGPYRRSGGPVATAAAGRIDGDRAMLSPVCDASADRPPAGRPRRWRAGWMLALSIVVLLVGVLAVSASAQPTTPNPDPCSGPEPRPIPCAPAPTPTQPTFPAPTTPGQPTTTPSQPCTGEDCIPQPTTPPPSTGPQQPGTGSGEGDSDCGITDIGACITEAINGAFRSIVDAALSPILELIGHTALSTPTISDLPGIGELWNNSWELVVAAYGLLILLGGIVVMGHESVQARYSIKEIGPRIPIAFMASALSLFFTDKLIRLANGLTLGILGDGVNAPSLGNTLKDAVAGIQTGGLFIILVGLVLVVVGLGLLVVYVVRIVITLVLIISGPLFLMFHALPHTDPLARWWWKAITATLAIQVAQALVLITAVCSTINFGLRTPAEQESLVASFGRYLHSLTAPVQVLVRAERLDLSGQIAELREQAGGLPHPALERAAREHAEYLDQLGRATDLLRRQVLLILREPLLTAGPTDGLGGASPLAALTAKRKAAKQAALVDDATRRAAEARLVRRLGEAVELLSPSGIVVTPLDAGQATAVLAAACNPDSVIPPNSGLAASDEVITTAPDEGWDPGAFGRAAFPTADEFGEAEDPDDYANSAGRYR